MSKKNDLKKAIADSQEEIERLERKRNRSQSALLQALLEHKNPDETDAEYFRVYSQLIELERTNLRKLKAELKQLEE
ncbi:MAG: hypothetical protein K2M95_01260 [Clostridiales bacterium]|nr:hypothetical protein [Clostridiales bacterium]